MQNNQDKSMSIMKQVFETMPPLLNERQRRLLAACIAKGYGGGGAALVSRTSGMDRRTVNAGMREIAEGDVSCGERVRRPGGGRNPVRCFEVNLLQDIEAIVSGDHTEDSVLTWTDLGLRDISRLLEERYGIKAGKDVVSRSLEELRYRKQGNRKMASEPHPNAAWQFRYIEGKARDFLKSGLPVLAVDGRKDLVRPKSGGTLASDGKKDAAYISVGAEGTTGLYGFESLHRWWAGIGKPVFPDAKKVYVIRVGDEYDGWRTILWDYELALFAERTDVEVSVSCLPPGTFRWERVRHVTYGYIPRTLEGDPVMDICTAISLLSPEDLPVPEAFVEKPGPVRIPAKATPARVSREAMGAYGSWNYIIRGFC